MDTDLAAKLKKKDTPIVIMTAYDYPTARVLDSCGVDWLLVGDSLAMVVLGLPDTTAVTVQEMLHHIRAVCRGAEQAGVIGDLPLAALDSGPAHALTCARQFIEAGSRMVKVEWRHDIEAILRAFASEGIPVMGHVGLTPQTAAQEGGFGIRGKALAPALEIIDQAERMQAAGCCSLVLECVPDELARILTRRLNIPTIGIGSGPGCDGQVVVSHDIVGFYEDFKPRFIRRYAELASTMRAAVSTFVKDVRRGDFPGEAQTVRMNTETLTALEEALK